MIIYLGFVLLQTSCGTPWSRLVPKGTKRDQGSALHASKDLAVSPKLLPVWLFH